MCHKLLSDSRYQKTDGISDFHFWFVSILCSILFIKIKLKWKNELRVISVEFKIPNDRPTLGTLRMLLKPIYLLNVEWKRDFKLNGTCIDLNIYICIRTYVSTKNHTRNVWIYKWKQYMIHTDVNTESIWMKHLYINIWSTYKCWLGGKIHMKISPTANMIDIMSWCAFYAYNMMLL